MASKIYHLSEISHYPVNWVDGMKINKNHFQQMNHAIADQIRDSNAIHINHLNYGLLSPTYQSPSSLELDIQIDAQNIISATLKTCRAILIDGTRVELTSQTSSDVYSGKKLLAQYEHSSNQNAIFAIAIQSNFINTIPAGKPDANEQPIRHPYVIPNIVVSIIPFEQASQLQSNYLILTKLIYNDGKWSKDEAYIPPCVAVQNHKKLNDAYVLLGNQLGELGSYCSNIVQKIKSEKNKTSLSLNIQYVSEKLISFLSDKIVFYRWLNGQRPPVYVIENFVSLAYCLKTTFDCVTEKDREEMFKYFEQWSNLKPIDFDNAIQDVLKIDYNHNDLAASVNGVVDFMELMVRLFGKLSKLKFIGEQTDTGIVIGETIEPKKTEKKTGWSFLAD